MHNDFDKLLEHQMELVHKLTREVSGLKEENRELHGKLSTLIGSVGVQLGKKSDRLESTLLVNKQCLEEKCLDLEDQCGYLRSKCAVLQSPGRKEEEERAPLRMMR